MADPHEMRSRILEYAARILLVLLVSGATTGCFVFEELDNSQPVHAPKPAKKPNAGNEGDALSLSHMIESGSEAIGGIRGKVKEAMKPAPDPDNTIVRCEVEGRAQFTRKHDCLVIGGIVMR